MSTVRSLGLHESSAIPFLVAEGLLPLDPPEELYSWKTTVDTGSNGPVEDELVWTKRCVVWSRAGVVKRVFRLDLEKEDIKHALLTNFSLGKVQRTSDRPSPTPGSAASQKTGRSPDEAEWRLPRSRGESSKSSSRALVVVLKSQAHIFFLQGNSHVVPLPFEVDSVFAAPRGLLFQRKVPDEDNSHPTVPPNSFMSFPLDFRASQSLEYPSSKLQRASLNTIPTQSPGWKSRTNKRADLPRVFSLMDPHSEMGLVVTNQSSRWPQTSISSRPSGFDVLDSADEIVYVSPKDELSQGNLDHEKSPLILVLTVNANTGLYTLWSARYREDEAAPSSKKKRRRETGGTRSKRRSSLFGMATGTTTPGARPPAARESFGPRGDNWNASVMSHSQYSTEGKPDDDEDDFASKLSRDFGDIGVPLKTSRRVSSLLARADLATSQDRITFSDLATGSQSSTIPPSGLRQSIGAGSARGSFGFNPRGSLPPATGSVYSTTSSFVDAPVDKLLEDLNNDNLFEGIENMDLKESGSGLPSEIFLSKLESFSSRFSGNFLTPSKLKPSRKLKVITLCPSANTSAQNGNSTTMALCVVDQEAKSMTVVNIKADKVLIPKKDAVFSKRAKKKASSEERSLLVQPSGIQHFSGVLDACKVVDGELSRIVTVNVTDDGSRILRLQTPWIDPIAIDLPSNLMLHETGALSSLMTVNRPREGSMKRVMTSSSITISALDHAAVGGKFDVVDSARRRHKMQIRMEPTNLLVKKVFNVLRFALHESDKTGDGLLTGWWESMKWLQERGTGENDIEWTALVIVLFAMAIPFIESDQARNTARQPRKNRGLLRSSSGSYVDTESWEAMLQQESGSTGVVAPWMNGTSWGWIVEQDAEDESTATHGRKPSKPEQLPSRSTCCKNTYVLRCAALTREFLQTPRGIAAIGTAGHLPTALANSQSLRRTALCTILVALHLLREEQKLSVCDGEQSHRPLGLLAPVLAQIGGWLGWPSWTWAEDSYYGMEIASINRWQFENTRISLLDVPPEPFSPPSIFAFLERAWRGPSSPFWTLLDLVNRSGTPMKGKLWQKCNDLTPRTLALDGFLAELHNHSTPLERIQLLHRWGFTRSLIETFPEGVSIPLYEAILQSQTHASTSWSPSLLGLIDRDDLSISLGNPSHSRPAPPPSQSVVSHISMRDYHHIGNSALEIDAINSFEASAEADRFSITRLIFRDDKRFIEAARLLNQSKAPAAECTPEPEWTDSDLLEAQKEVVQLVTLRTLSIPTGRAMLAFSGRLPLLTEKLPIPSFSLQCIMKPSNVTISADRASFSEEKVCWAFFHNGVSTGLAISRVSKGIDTSWILFNKPQDLTNRHAGFLLALGLNGHLKSLAKWVAFKYLTPKHTMTSIGLLLGLSASYLGTMDTLITRLLSVHVTRMLPHGAAELNLSALTQTAGIMGIGLLYCNSQHRRMSEVMLSEIENAMSEEGSAAHEDLRDEGYRLAAGFALGFINLGKGKDLKGMRDMHIVERLLGVAVGTKNVDLAHILDRATPGATIALAIIFMKTNDETLAQKIDIPDTTVRFDYVRPDLFLLRTLARHVIMWDSIRPSGEWFVQSLPEVYRRRYRLIGVRQLKSNDMPFFNIIGGLCFALGLRYAGSANPGVRDILLSYLDQYIRICRLPAANYDGKLARNSVRHCQDVVALSAAAVMAGTGDLALFRRLRSLHGRVDPDTPYGSHMAAHMAIGLLFLGGGSHTLGTSDLAVASLICSLYPIFPTTVLDNKCHLQAFRHLWVLAAEPRCLIPRDLDSRRPVSIPITVTSPSGDSRMLTAPCLLPDLSFIAKVEVRSSDYWPLVLDFASNPVLRDKFRQGDQSIYLRRKATYNPAGTSVFGSILAGLSDAQDILPSSSTSASNQGKGLPPTALPNVSTLLSIDSQAPTPNSAAQNIWDWIFQLQSLQTLLDPREQSLVLPSSFPSRPRPSSVSYDAPWLRQSAVDSKLVTECTVQNAVQAAQGRGADPDETRDRLWQLRLLFSWIDTGLFTSDGNEETQGEHGSPAPSSGLWLRRDYIEEAKWRIWGIQTGDYAALGK